MKTSHYNFHSLVVSLGDFLGAALLSIVAALLGPLGILRGALVFGNFLNYIMVLCPLGVLTRFIRSAIDWRLGNFDAAVFQLEFLITRVEALLTRNPQSEQIRLVLEDFFTLLARAQMHGGHVDEAMSTILRAKKVLNCDKLPAMPRLDAKTAHLVRAGLAAGKLLDGSGLAALYVKASDVPPPPSPRGKPSTYKPTIPMRQGASRAITGSPIIGQKIIPFPSVPKNQSAGSESDRGPDLTH